MNYELCKKAIDNEAYK